MACHIPLDLSPYPPLGISQGIGQILYDIFSLPDRLNGKMAGSILGLFFHHAHSQDEKQEFIKHQPSSAEKHILFISWKMDLGNGKIIFRQVIVTAEVLRQILLHHFLFLQCLMHGLDHQLIGKPLCKPVNRIQGMQHLPVLFRCEYLRMLHGKMPLFLRDHSAEYVTASRSNGISQKRHIIPG